MAEWHNIEWDHQKIARFWDFSARWSAWQDDYFSKQHGQGIVNFLGKLGPLQGTTLDFGCGPGYLEDYLLAAGIACEAVDSSSESLEAVNQRQARNPLWKGARLYTNERLPYPDGAVDTLICVETIEHILPSEYAKLVGEFKRVLKPGTGRLLITTPNAEVLERSIVYCPECGAATHRYQHMASFTSASLAALMERQGLDTMLCNVTDFRRFQEPFFPIWKDWSPRQLKRMPGLLKVALQDALPGGTPPLGGYRFQKLIGRGPHLFWLGRKAAP